MYFLTKSKGLKVITMFGYVCFTAIFYHCKIKTLILLFINHSNHSVPFSYKIHSKNNQVEIYHHMVYILLVSEVLECISDLYGSDFIQKIMTFYGPLIFRIIWLVLIIPSILICSCFSSPFLSSSFSQCLPLFCRFSSSLKGSCAYEATVLHYGIIKIKSK